MRDATDRITCRTPNAPGTTRIPRWKYDVLRAAILDSIPEGGLAWKDLTPAVGSRLDPDIRADLGSLGWHVVCVKLEMEVAGDLTRMPGRSPQWLTRT